MPPRSAELAKAAQGVAQVAPTVSAALSAPTPPPPPPPAPAEARTEPRRVPKPQGSGTPRRGTPPPPRTPAPSAVSAEQEQYMQETGWRPPMVDDVAELREAMQRVDDLRQARDPMIAQRTPILPGAALFLRTPMDQRRGGGYQDKLSYMPTPTNVTPAPEEALRSVAAFRQELKQRMDAYRGMGDVVTETGIEKQRLDAVRPRLASVKPTPQQKAIDDRYAAFSQKLADLRADLIEMGLTQDQIDKLSK